MLLSDAKQDNLQKAGDFPQGCDMNMTFRRTSGVEGNRIYMTKWFILLFLLIGPVCHAQSATVDWSNVHQVIDGFGANDFNDSGSAHATTLSSAQASFFFGTGDGQIGLSILRVGGVNNEFTGPYSYGAGNCTTVSASCVGLYAGDIAFAKSFGANIFIEQGSPPALYMTNNSVVCGANGGGGTLAASHFGDFATWLVNEIKSIQQFEGANVIAITFQGEPEYCPSNYPGAEYPASTVQSFTKSSLGPALSAGGLSSVMIMMPSVGRYGNLAVGANCGTDPACPFGGVEFSDYDATVNINTGTVNSTPYPSGWISSGKHYWMGEISCQSGGGGPSFCNASFDPSMTNALNWALLIDHRFVTDNVNAWNYFWFLIPGAVNSGEALMASDTGLVAKRAYVMGQYSRFIRPGYFRIDATNKPQAGVSVSAYQDKSGGNLAIVATNYTGSPVNQKFNVVNAPTFTNVTPYITSATQSIQAQSAQSVSSNSFTYTLPAQSVTTFVGTSSGSTGPAPPTKVQAVVN